MSESTDLLGLSAKRSRLHALAGAGLLDRAQLERALAAADLRPSQTSWSRYLYWHALLIGVVLLVAGAVFFVAANWSALSGDARIGLVAGAMVAATLVGGYLGASLTGRATSLLGGLLFGPLIAVYGQVYQTGADAWQLFAWWALVLVASALLVRFVGTKEAVLRPVTTQSTASRPDPRVAQPRSIPIQLRSRSSASGREDALWAASGHNTASWVMALICVHVAWFSWIDQELGSDMFEDRHAWLIAALALVDAGIVALAERLLVGREREVLVHCAGVFGLGVVLPFGILSVFELEASAIPGLVVLFAGLSGIWLVYRWRRPRLGMLVAFAAVVTILLTALLGRILIGELDAELFGVALLGALVCAMVWGFTRWLLGWRREHPVALAPEPESANQPEDEPRRRRPSLRELLAALGGSVEPGDPRVAEALHDADASDAPLIVRVFTVIGTWIGALMLAMLFIAFELYEVAPLALLIALGLIVGAALLSRRPGRSLVQTQLVWAMALGAHGLVFGVLLELGLDDDVLLAATWTALNVGLLVLIRVPSFQLVSAVCAVGFATWLAAALELPAYPLWVALPIAALATAAWVFEAAWAARLGRTFSALGYGLPLGVVGPLTLIGVDTEVLLVTHGWSTTIATLVLVGLIGVVLWRAQAEQGTIARRTHIIGGVALVSVLAARHVPGLSLALLWLLLAHLRRSVELQIIALIQLAGFLFFFYYQLETTLLRKSLWVLSTGAVLLLGAWLGRTRDDDEGRERAPRRSRWLPAIALTLLSCGIVGGGIVQKELILARGQTVLLPLAPVDPRSLMQGDYMVLRYELEREMGLLEPWEREPGFADPFPRHGRLVLRVDEHGVGRFARIDDGGELREDERLLEYRLREGWNGRVRIGAESFLFEEGTAQVYEAARYGELVVAEGGEAVLVGLRDEQRRPLGERLH